VDEQLLTTEHHLSRQTGTSAAQNDSCHKEDPYRTRTENLFRGARTRTSGSRPALTGRHNMKSGRNRRFEARARRALLQCVSMPSKRIPFFCRRLIPTGQLFPTSANRSPVNHEPDQTRRSKPTGSSQRVSVSPTGTDLYCGKCPGLFSAHYYVVKLPFPIFSIAQGH